MPAKILTEKDLNMFLRILAQESTRNAYESELKSALLEKDEEDPLFGGDDEGDDEGLDLGGDEEPQKDDEKGGDDLDLDMGDDSSGGEDAEPAPEEPEKEEKVHVRPTPLTLELGEVTSDGLIATLNMVRAGRSFKEPDVAAQLKKYFEEQLNDSERLALATFLSALRDLTSGTPAEEAPEPDDENLNIDATRSEKMDQAPAPREPSTPALQTRQRPAGGRGMEDTSAPIQVGPRDARLAEEYRKHIRSLIS